MKEKNWEGGKVREIVRAQIVEGCMAPCKVERHWHVLGREMIGLGYFLFCFVFSSVKNTLKKDKGDIGKTSWEAIR